MSSHFRGRRDQGGGDRGAATRKSPRVGGETHVSAAAEASSGVWDSRQQSARMQRVVSRGWQRMSFRRQFVLLLTSATLTCTLGTSAVAYVGVQDAGVSRGPAQTLAGLLLVVGLLLSAAFAVIAYRVSGPVSRRAFTTLSMGLSQVSDAAAHVGQLAQAQTARASRQRTTARHLIDELRALSDVAHALEEGVTMLRESASQLWADSSYPGAMPITASHTRIARAVAVAASQIGGAADQAGALCQRMRAITNQIIAEAGVLGENGQQSGHCVTELDAALQRIEATLGGSVASPSPTLQLTGLAGKLQDALAQVSVIKDRSSSDAAQSVDVSDATRASAHPPDAAPSSRAARRGASFAHPTISTPRAARPGRPNTHPHLQDDGSVGAASYRTPSGGPRLSGNHAAILGRSRTPWYSDEQDLADAMGDAGGLPLAGGQSTRPHVTSHPRPRGGEWLND